MTFTKSPTPYTYYNMDIILDEKSEEWAHHPFYLVRYINSWKPAHIFRIMGPNKLFNNNYHRVPVDRESIAPKNIDDDSFLDLMDDLRCDGAFGDDDIIFIESPYVVFTESKGSYIPGMHSAYGRGKPSIRKKTMLECFTQWEMQTETNKIAFFFRDLDRALCFKLRFG
jgi:hypothetical protein